MKLNAILQNIWCSYWFRLLMTGVANTSVGLVVAILVLSFRLRTVESITLIFTVFITYINLIEERHLKSWRLETLRTTD